MSDGLSIARRVVGAGPRNEDRAEVMRRGEVTVLVLADGAGGRAGGAEAAEGVLEYVRRELKRAEDPTDARFWCAALREADEALRADPEAGETTAVILAVCPEVLVGASVGDSGAFLLTDNRCVELTAAQHRKPFIGTGAARPTPVDRRRGKGRLLVATDGLLAYAGRSEICSAAGAGEPETAAEELVNLVRLPSGSLQDDVALILCDL